MPYSTAVETESQLELAVFFQPPPGRPSGAVCEMTSASTEFLATRRSPRLGALAAPVPSEVDLRTMLTIAARVPDHGRLVPWRFVTIRGERRHILSDAISTRFGRLYPDAPLERRQKMQGRMAQAPAVVVVIFCPREHPKIPEWEQYLTVGAVCLNLLHAARSLGYAGLWLTEWYAYDPVVLYTLGLTDEERVAGFVHIGTPTEHRGDRPRPDVEAITTDF